MIEFNRHFSDRLLERKAHSCDRGHSRPEVGESPSSGEVDEHRGEENRRRRRASPETPDCERPEIYSDCYPHLPGTRPPYVGGEYPHIPGTRPPYIGGEYHGTLVGPNHPLFSPRIRFDPVNPINP